MSIVRAGAALIPPRPQSVTPSPPDVRAVAERFAAAEARGGGAGPLSVRDTVRAGIGGATLTVAYGRPLRCPRAATPCGRSRARREVR